MTRHLSFLFAVLLLLPSPLAAAKQVPKNIKKSSVYEIVRPSLVKNGWKPVGLKMQQEGSCDEKIDDRCKTYPEARECSGTGMAFCNMVWMHKDGTVIIITTGGEGKAVIVNVAQK